MKNVFTCMLVCLIFNSCGLMIKLNVPIEKNKLVGNSTFEFTKQNITVNPDEVFLLSKMGLKANGLVLSNEWVTEVIKIPYATKQFKKGKFINYDVLITNPAYPKKYYGKIAFFNTFKKAEGSLVTKSREISIDEMYFDAATNGRTAIMYEYSVDNTNPLFPNATSKTPTWVLLMSDEPIF